MRRYSLGKLCLDVIVRSGLHNHLYLLIHFNHRYVWSKEGIGFIQYTLCYETLITIVSL